MHPDLDRLARAVVDAAYRVHSTLGPGLLESVYEACLCHELTKRRIPFARQVAYPVLYDGIRIEGGMRLDLLVDDRLIVELKTAERHNPVFDAQLLTYLKLTGCRLGLLINFNVPQIKQGIRRLVL
ncbi:GxxExxY protein [Caenispirillum bisanense]|uniref:GxxExxY protein n=1 Tax=Caenispirillum bisanense TaxID=414052 RepID=UPI0031E00C09